MLDLQQMGSLVSHRLTMACVLGLLTWFGINELTRNEKALTIEDVTVEQGADWVVLEKSVDSVRANFRGSRNEILRLDPSELRIVIPINSDDKTIVDCEILPRHVIAPGGVSVESIAPRMMTIVRSRVEESREFTLNNVVVRTLADAGSTALSVEPQEVAVTVKGAKDSLDENNLKRIRAFVDCVGLAPASSDDLAVQVDLPPGLQLLNVAPKTVNVQAAAVSEPEPPGPVLPAFEQPTNPVDPPEEIPEMPSDTDDPAVPLGSDPLDPPLDPDAPDSPQSPGTLAAPENPVARNPQPATRAAQPDSRTPLPATRNPQPAPTPADQ